jgi:hypothetical protein
MRWKQYSRRASIEAELLDQRALELFSALHFASRCFSGFSCSRKAAKKMPVMLAMSAWEQDEAYSDRAKLRQSFEQHSQE